MNFKDALLKSIDAEVAAGTMSGQKAAILRSVTKRPVMMMLLEHRAELEARRQGKTIKAGKDGAVDWTKLMGFLGQLLPVLLQLLAMLPK